MLQENHNCTDCHSSCLINKYCSKQWKQIIERQKTTGVYREKQVVFSEDNLVFGVYFIHKGKVKIFNTGKQGKQHIVRFANSGDVLGFKGYSDKNYRISCTALDDTVVCFLEENFFFSAIKKNPEFALALVQYYARELAFSEFHQKNLVQFNTRNRVAEALLMLRKYFGVAADRGILLDVNFSQHEIAAIAGITVEEANRCLSFLKREGIIDYRSHKKITLLNVDKLFEMILDNCCDKDMYVNQQKCCEHLL